MCIYMCRSPRRRAMRSTGYGVVSCHVCSGKQTRTLCVSISAPNHQPSLQSLQPCPFISGFFFFLFNRERQISFSVVEHNFTPCVFLVPELFYFWHVVSCFHFTKSESSPNYLFPISPGTLKNKSKTSISTPAGWENTLITHTLDGYKGLVLLSPTPHRVSKPSRAQEPFY